MSNIAKEIMDIKMGIGEVEKLLYSYEQKLNEEKNDLRPKITEIIDLLQPVREAIVTLVRSQLKGE